MSDDDPATLRRGLRPLRWLVAAVALTAVLVVAFLVVQSRSPVLDLDDDSARLLANDPVPGSIEAAGKPDAEPEAVVLPDYGDPERFAALCERIRTTAAARYLRYYRATHVEAESKVQLDGDGAVISKANEVRRVWFLRTDPEDPGRQQEVLTSTSEGAAFPGQSDTKDKKTRFPLEPDAPDGSYDLTFAGVEDQGGVAAVRIDFTPREPLAEKVSGSYWYDAATAEPIRCEAQLAQPPWYANFARFTIDYAPTGTGGVQTVRWKTVGEGSLFGFKRGLVAEVQFADYVPPAAD